MAKATVFPVACLTNSICCSYSAGAMIKENVRFRVRLLRCKWILTHYLIEPTHYGCRPINNTTDWRLLSDAAQSKSSFTLTDCEAKVTFFKTLLRRHYQHERQTLSKASITKLGQIWDRDAQWSINYHFVTSWASAWMKQTMQWFQKVHTSMYVINQDVNCFVFKFCHCSQVLLSNNYRLVTGTLWLVR